MNPSVSACFYLDPTGPLPVNHDMCLALVHTVELPEQDPYPNLPDLDLGPAAIELLCRRSWTSFASVTVRVKNRKLLHSFAPNLAI